MAWLTVTLVFLLSGAVAVNASVSSMYRREMKKAGRKVGPVVEFTADAWESYETAFTGFVVPSSMRVSTLGKKILRLGIIVALLALFLSTGWPIVVFVATLIF